ncbi:MAG TPA: MGMT family protein [Candidatus Saccharimonadales bacterium]
MNQNAYSFRQRVESVVAGIPKGMVMTYGQIAALCGNASSARIVGGIAHFGDPELPWQRVVNHSGGLASGYPGGKISHQKSLEAEGINFNEENKLDLSEYLYRPGAEND